MIKAIYILLATWPDWLPSFAFGVLISSLLVWALWLNWPSRRR